MPCYNVQPSCRRSAGYHHFNPFFQPQQVRIVPRYAPGPQVFFRNFERELSEFENFFREVDKSLAAVERQEQQQQVVFQPKFDVKEESDKFILHGELPGVKPENLSIEFVNKNTLVIKGKAVRQETHGAASTETETPASALAQQAHTQAVEEKKTDEDFDFVDASEKQDTAETQDTSDTVSEKSSSNYHKASVEDEEGETSNEVTAPTPTPEIPQQAAPEQQEQEQEPQPRYVVSERTIGEFRRAFKFPGKVNQDSVKASLRDGILTVAVPKVVEVLPERRKIEVEGA